MSQDKETGTVRYGGQVHTIGAFTLDELQVICPLIDEYFAIIAKSGSWAEALAPGRKIVAAALRVSEEEAGKLPSAIDEMWDVVEEVAKVSGLKRMGERMRAMVAARKAAQTGTTSMPSLSPSAPAPGATSDA